MKGNHLFYEMVQMTVKRFIMEGRCNAFGEKNHLGEAYTETRGENMPIFIFAKTL